MEVGIKTWSSNGAKRIKQISEVCDFMEVMPIANRHLPSLKKIETKWTVHARHEHHGFNLADARNEKINKKIISDAIYYADALDAKTIVVHGGILANKQCSEEHTIAFLKEVNDKRIVIENMTRAKTLTSNPDGLVRITQAAKLGICFDFSHAQMAAVRNKIPYLSLLRKFMKLKPRYFHICDGWMGKATDEHLNLRDGDFDIPLFKKLIGRKPVALEVDHTSTIERVLVVHHTSTGFR